MRPPWDRDNCEDDAKAFRAMEEIAFLALLLQASSLIFYAYPGTFVVFPGLVLVSWLRTRKRVNETRSVVRRLLFGRLMPLVYFGLCIATYAYILASFPAFMPEVLLGVLTAPGMVVVLMRPFDCDRSVKALAYFWIAFAGGTAFVSLFLGVLPYGIVLLFELAVVKITVDQFLTTLDVLGREPSHECGYGQYLRNLGDKRLVKLVLKVTGEVLIEVIAGLIVILILGL